MAAILRQLWNSAALKGCKNMRSVRENYGRRLAMENCSNQRIYLNNQWLGLRSPRRLFARREKGRGDRVTNTITVQLQMVHVLVQAIS